MMRADASLHPDQARRQVGKSRLDLATRPFLPEYDRTTPIVPYDVKRVLADIDTNHGNCAARFLRHGALLFGAPNQLRSLAGLEHGRTMPLAVFATRFCIRSGSVTHRKVIFCALSSSSLMRIE
ncbi:hypothetical protein Q2941_25935 [Bradyrhizobium sp. UFLA05-153]